MRQTVHDANDAPDGAVVTAGSRGGLSYDPALNNKKPKASGERLLKSLDKPRIEFIQSGSRVLARDYDKSDESRAIVKKLCECVDIDEAIDAINNL